jgi:DNA processing protein
LKREEYNYWLANINNIGVRKIEWLLSVFGCAEEVYRAERKTLMTALAIETADAGTKLREEDIEALIQSRDEGKIQKEYSRLQQSGIRFITQEDEDYPEKLKRIYGAPYALYVRGRLPEKDKKLLAVVGARDCSNYGREMARYLAGAIAKEGVAIVSGLARGIDSFAHQGALEAGGITYGILGCGIDICYPKENITLYMELMKEGGVISEYAPGTPPIAGNFPMRNRIISGLSDGILVIEAREKSGSLITVDMGLDQGKDIYAVPGKATDRLSEGCNNLIKMGAKLVTAPKDILEELFPNYEQNINVVKNNLNLLESHGKIVYASLDFEPRHIEELAARTKLPMDVLMEQLLLLELNGLVHQTMKNYYVLRN